jgi:hypothetical protein
MTTDLSPDGDALTDAVADVLDVPDDDAVADGTAAVVTEPCREFSVYEGAPVASP